MRTLKNILINVVTFSLIMIFTIGIIFSAEILWRLFGKQSNGTTRELALFPYKHYLVSTHPQNLVLGNSNHVLEQAFPKGVCTAKDGVTTARFNSEGFRAEEFDAIPPKQPNEIRIIITGASVAISFGTGESCTLDANLQKLLSNHYPNKKIRIINLGNGAWKSFQELIALQLYGLKLAPDLVIAFDGVNDISHSFAMDIAQPYSNNVTRAYQRYERFANGSIYDLFVTLKFVDALKDPVRQCRLYFEKKRTEKSLNAQNAKNASSTSDSSNSPGASGSPHAPLSLNMYPKFAKAPKPGSLETEMSYPFDFEAIEKRNDFDPHNQEAVNFYLMNERLMAKSLQTVGAKMLFALSPNIYFKTPLSPSEQKSLHSFAKSANYFVQGYLRVKKGLSLIAKEEPNTYYYDMTNIFDGMPNTIFGDEAHLDKEGYEIVARQLYPKIVAILENTLEKN